MWLYIYKVVLAVVVVVSVVSTVGILFRHACVAHRAFVHRNNDNNNKDTIVIAAIRIFASA